METFAAYSTVGLRDVVCAPLLTDNGGTVIYGDVTPLKGAMEARISPQNREPTVRYNSDGYEIRALLPDPEIQIRLKLLDIPLEMRSRLLGDVFDENGVLLPSAARKVKYFALGFRSLKTNGKYRYTWYYKCRAKVFQERYATKQPKPTAQTPEIEITAIKLASNGRYEAIGDEDMPGFSGAYFLSSVYGCEGDYALVVDGAYRLSEDGTEFIMITDPTASCAVTESGTALIFTTT